MFQYSFIVFFNYDHKKNRMGVANAECYIESDIKSFYLCEKDCNVKCFNTPLLFFIIMTIGYLHRMGEVNAECYIERDISIFLIYVIMAL